MGRLDEGGGRGECAGLFSLLDDITTSIAQSFGPVLCLAEAMFDLGPKMEIDLITAGVWVPIATALMADAGIKMAIFSPGIASILQANYIALDTFLSELAMRLLKESGEQRQTDVQGVESLYFKPKISMETVLRAQERIYAHPKTADFSKKWNLPIYYQLRFGDCCNRLNTAIENTRREGWIASVFTGSEDRADYLKGTFGFELPLFMELYDILLGLWQPDVILRPLTHRFLRGAVQLVGRTVHFIGEGMEGNIKFGNDVNEESASHENGQHSDANGEKLSYPARKFYCWAESEHELAAVAWELAILETSMCHDYVSTVSSSIAGGDCTEAELAELRKLASEVLKESVGQIRPLVDKAWNQLIVQILVGKCSGPLAAVKGVAATYRMTNRPPPTQASPFVLTILRPLKELDKEFASRTPDYIDGSWKRSVVSTVAERYSAAVEDLIAAVKRGEVALQNRRARRAASGGMSDGDKVKLQLYLDFQEFSRHVTDVGVDISSIVAIDKLRSLTSEAEQLQARPNGSSSS